MQKWNLTDDSKIKPAVKLWKTKTKVFGFCQQELHAVSEKTRIWPLPISVPKPYFKGNEDNGVDWRMYDINTGAVNFFTNKTS